MDPLDALISALFRDPVDPADLQALAQKLGITLLPASQCDVDTQAANIARAALRALITESSFWAGLSK